MLAIRWLCLSYTGPIQVNNKKIGTVRYKGETHFKPGVTLYDNFFFFPFFWPISRFVGSIPPHARRVT